jgi:hypothetical protein
VFAEFTTFIALSVALVDDPTTRSFAAPFGVDVPMLALKEASTPIAPDPLPAEPDGPLIAKTWKAPTLATARIAATEKMKIVFAFQVVIAL